MTRFFQIAVGVAVFALLLSTLDIASTVASARQVRWWAIVLAVTLQLLLFALASVRWWILLNCHVRGYRPATLLAPYFIGILLGNVLPTGFGGSLFRMYYIYRNSHGAAAAVSPIITERLVGLVAMIATAAVVVPFLSREQAYMRMLANTLPWLLAFAFTVLVLIGSRRTHSGVQAALALGRQCKALKAVLPIVEALHAYHAHPWTLARVFSISVGLQMMSAGVYYLLGLGLGATLALPDFLVIVPLIFVASAMPVSIGGFGVREAAAVSLFVAAGMSAAHAGALAFLYLAVLLLGSLPGLYFLLTMQDFNGLYRQVRRQTAA